MDTDLTASIMISKLVAEIALLTAAIDRCTTEMKRGNDRVDEMPSTPADMARLANEIMDEVGISDALAAMTNSDSDQPVIEKPAIVRPAIQEGGSGAA